MLLRLLVFRIRKSTFFPRYAQDWDLCRHVVPALTPRLTAESMTINKFRMKTTMRGGGGKKALDFKISPALPTSHREQASPFGRKGIYAEKARRRQAGWHTLSTTSTGSRQSLPAWDITLLWNWATGKQ